MRVLPDPLGRWRVGAGVRFRIVEVSVRVANERGEERCAYLPPGGYQLFSSNDGTLCLAATSSPLMAGSAVLVTLTEGNPR